MLLIHHAHFSDFLNLMNPCVFIEILNSTHNQGLALRETLKILFCHLFRPIDFLALLGLAIILEIFSRSLK